MIDTRQSIKFFFIDNEKCLVSKVFFLFFVYNLPWGQRFINHFSNREYITMSNTNLMKEKWRPLKLTKLGFELNPNLMALTSVFFPTELFYMIFLWLLCKINIFSYLKFPFFFP